jgi:hypothetical protein
LATKGKTGAQPRPKSIKELDRAAMMSLKSKKTKRISPGHVAAALPVSRP